MYDEEVNGDEPFAYVDPVKPWKKMKFENVDVKELQVPIFRDGKLVYDKPELDAIKAYVTEQLDHQIWEEEQRFTNPHIHYVDLSKNCMKSKKRCFHRDKESFTKKYLKICGFR